MSEQSILKRLAEAKDALRGISVDLEIYNDMWDMAESVGSDDIIDQINVKRKKLLGKRTRLTNLVNKLEFQVKGFESRRDPKIKKLQDKIAELSHLLDVYSIQNLHDSDSIKYKSNENENLKSSNLELCKVIENLKFENNSLIAKNNKLIKDTADLAEQLKSLGLPKPKKSWFDWR